MNREFSDEHMINRSQSLLERKLTDEHDGETKNGGKKSTCKHGGCDKWLRSGGFCGEHGGKRKKSTCKHGRCDRLPSNGGFCGDHGGKRTCRHDGSYLEDFVVTTVGSVLANMVDVKSFH